MHRQAADRHAHGLRRERLDLEIAEPRAVEGVRDVGAEGVEVEVLRPAPDLLVDRERDADGAARPLRVAGQVRDRGHDLRDPGLVVRAEERRAVARDDVVSHARGQLRELVRVEHLALVARKLDRRAVPVLVHDRRDAGARDVRRRVHVRDEPDRGSALDAGQAREHGGALGQLGVDAELAELFEEQSGKIQLLLGARALRRAVRALRVDPGVAQEPLEGVGRELLRELAHERCLRSSQALRAG